MFFVTTVLKREDKKATTQNVASEASPNTDNSFLRALLVV